MVFDCPKLSGPQRASFFKLFESTCGHLNESLANSCTNSEEAVDASGAISYGHDDVIVEVIGDKRNGTDCEFSDISNDNREEISINALGQSSSSNDNSFNVDMNKIDIDKVFYTPTEGGIKRTAAIVLILEQQVLYLALQHTIRIVGPLDYLERKVWNNWNLHTRPSHFEKQFIVV